MKYTNQSSILLFRCLSLRVYFFLFLYTLGRVAACISCIVTSICFISKTIVLSLEQYVSIPIIACFCFCCVLYVFLWTQIQAILRLTRIFSNALMWEWIYVPLYIWGVYERLPRYPNTFTCFSHPPPPCSREGDGGSQFLYIFLEKVKKGRGRAMEGLDMPLSYTPYWQNNIPHTIW